MIESTDSETLSVPSAAKDSAPSSPPSAFISPARKAKKRSSDEFAFDQSGFLIPKAPSITSTREKEDKSTRKHHSYALGTSATSTSTRDRRRSNSIRMSLGSSSKPGLGRSRSTNHTRQQSATSSFSARDANRRDQHNAENLSSSPANQLSTGVTKASHGPSAKPSLDRLSVIGKDKDVHSSPNVAHSLLRGTQEGWSALDDDATAEALRKLDGIYGKNARARGSLGLASRSSNHSRPGTPGTTRGHRSDGTESSDALRRRVSNGGLSNVTSNRTHERVQHEELSTNSDKELVVSSEQAKPVAEPGLLTIHTGQTVDTSGSENDQAEIIVMNDKEVRKSLPPALRSSFTPKRSSASSTNYTGTPTSSSRDSASLSTTTSATSASVASGRFSTGKARRNSAGSDISSVHSNDAASQRDRAASLVAGDVVDGNAVPPVPPLPKDLSYYKSPPQSSASMLFPNLDHGKDLPPNAENESTRSISLDVPSLNEPLSLPGVDTAKGDSIALRENPKTPSSTSKTPSKKWSFTNALSLRRANSPGHDSSKSSSGKTPHSSRKLRTSASNEASPSAVISPKSSVEAWQNIQKSAMNSETSLASLSSVNSIPELSPPASPSHGGFKGVPARSMERSGQSRSGTASSGSTNHASATHLDIGTVHSSPSSKSHRESSNKRLTPSSIPFFRRSSSQSMQIPPSSATTAMSTSPTYSSAPNLPKGVQEKGQRTPGKSSQTLSPTTPGSQRKSSMLSLGLPSLLKGSSSRKSLHIEKSQPMISDIERSKPKESDSERAKLKKDEKDRSESRISILMGRKRGKVWCDCTTHDHYVF